MSATATSETVWLTTAEAAAKAGVTTRAMQRYASSGRVRAKRCLLSGRLYVDAADLDRALAGELIEPPAAEE